MRRFLALTGIFVVLWTGLLPAEAARKSGRLVSNHQKLRANQSRLFVGPQDPLEGIIKPFLGIDIGSESLPARLNDLAVRYSVATGVLVVTTLQEGYLRPFMEAIEEAELHRIKTALVSSKFREIAEKDGTEAMRAVDTVYTALLHTQVGKTEPSHEFGGLELLPARRIPGFFKGETTVNPEPRWSILDDWTVKTFNYHRNNAYRGGKKEVPYQDHIQYSVSAQRDKPRKQQKVQEIRELMKDGNFREWSARNTTEQQQRVLEDVSRRETYQWIAKKHGTSTKTIQRVISDLWNMITEGAEVEKYTEEFREFISKNGSDRQQHIMTMLPDKTPAYIAITEGRPPRTIQREVRVMGKMARDAGVRIRESVQVRPFLSNPAVE